MQQRIQQWMRFTTFTASDRAADVLVTQQ
jgi:hypothetical protein